MAVPDLDAFPPTRAAETAAPTTGRFPPRERGLQSASVLQAVESAIFPGSGARRPPCARGGLMPELPRRAVPVSVPLPVPVPLPGSLPVPVPVSVLLPVSVPVSVSLSVPATPSAARPQGWPWAAVPGTVRA